MPSRAHTTVAWGLATVALTVAATIYLYMGPGRLGAVDSKTLSVLLSPVILFAAVCASALHRRRDTWFERRSGWWTTTLKATLAYAVGVGAGCGLGEWIVHAFGVTSATTLMTIVAGGALGASTVLAPVIGRALARRRRPR